MVVIDDADGPTSIAGLMGGARSEVAPETTRVLLEVATWDGPNIHRASWRLGLRSEASARFEKGLAPEQCLHAQAVATRLLIELLPARACCRARSTSAAAAAAAARSCACASARRGDPRRADPSAQRQREILRALDFAAATAPDGLDVTVPPLRRADVTREVDLIEEVARIDGLERLPATLPARRGAAGRLTHAQRVRRAAEDALAGRGLHEVVGWSFTEPALLDRLLLRRGAPAAARRAPREPAVGGAVDHAPDAARLAARRRPAQRRAQRPGRGDLRVGHRLSRAGRRTPPREPADEHHALGVLLSGALAPRSWRGEPHRADFFAAKALLAALLDHFHVALVGAARASWPFLHPGRAAAVLARDGAGEPTSSASSASCTRCVAGAWDPDSARPRSRSTSASSPRSLRRRSPSARSAPSRRCARTSRSCCPSR